MRIHILGICGTFMGGLAVLAKQLGFEVTGSDANIYPPMSGHLRNMQIEIQEGYDPAHLQPSPDLVIVGNTISRGNPALEFVLNKHIPFVSGAAWLYTNVLQKKHVLAVSGTHGKTTCSSILAWILTYAGLKPGYLIGGIANNFSSTAELGDSDYFVIEADEYDTAFFDKRPKFLHYYPRTLVINNIEFDHADIYPNIEAIKSQFELLIRIVPGCGTIIYPENDREITDVMSRGCWSATNTIDGPNAIWQAKNISHDQRQFELWHRDQKLGVINWKMMGKHNIHNALAAIAAAHDIGVTADVMIAACERFDGVKRRLELRGEINQIAIYDDFAHHPTAIEKTIASLRAAAKERRIIAVLDFASNSMRMGSHRDLLASSLILADKVVLHNPGNLNWDIQELLSQLGSRAAIFKDVNSIITHLQRELKPHDQVLIMSNRGFDGIHQRLLNQLQNKSLHSHHEERAK